MVSTSIRSTGRRLYLDRRDASRGVELQSFPFLIGTSPCAVMRGTRRGKQKGAGALPEMASGTLPLLRQFGSRRDELITREECVHQGVRGGNELGLTTPCIQRPIFDGYSQIQINVNILSFLLLLQCTIFFLQCENFYPTVRSYVA